MTYFLVEKIGGGAQLETMHCMWGQKIAANFLLLGHINPLKAII